MSVDTETVKRVARLARIAVSDDEADALRTDLNNILGFVEQLDEVDVAGVEPMTSVVEAEARMRDDIVNDGDKVDSVVANAPRRTDGFFVVPRVVE